MKYEKGLKYRTGNGSYVSMLDKDQELYFEVFYTGNMGTRKEQVFEDMRQIPGLQGSSFEVIEETGSPDYAWKAVVKVV